ncbi:nucleotidyl transferase AbiEii/AbiGii toxin family protein [Comamonas sp. 23]|uniref:nucleotidyl transferase AbiEii/AbiGii toxin family protein n=1 Tax=Comamonas sp. 23 TaxID=3415008 RepID=UPI003C7057A1
MTKNNGVPAEVLDETGLNAIKRAAVVAMFADDDLMDILVLKGGNAMDLVHKVSSRSSVDLDFSMKADLDHEAALPKLEKALQRTFLSLGYHAFDIHLRVKPGKMPDALATFWGGYMVEFKLISQARAGYLNEDLEQMRREAIKLGEGSKFTIDISRHEYIDDKEPHDLDGYMIYVYSPMMIVCEKLRAICQQMPDYGQVIQRSRSGTERARDFVDIETLVRMFDLDITSESAIFMLTEIFKAKHVPLRYLEEISSPAVRELHRLGFPAVTATMHAGVDIKDFDFYFDFVTAEVSKLESFWDM